MTAKTILITRPPGDEIELSDALHALGLRVIHEPLTQIFLLHTARPELARALYHDPDAVIVTSRHGARALATLSELRDVPLIAVGRATADVAQSCGFARVFDAGGDVEKLLRYIADAYDQGARFLYVSADQVQADLPSLLAAKDMYAERIVAYEAVAAEQLSDTLVEHVKRGRLDAVTLFSQRAAHIFTALLAKAGLEETTAGLHVFALSDAVAEPLLSYPWKTIHIAREPTLASLVQEVDNALRDKES